MSLRNILLEHALMTISPGSYTLSESSSRVSAMGGGTNTNGDVFIWSSPRPITVRVSIVFELVREILAKRAKYDLRYAALLAWMTDKPAHSWLGQASDDVRVAFEMLEMLDAISRHGHAASMGSAMLHVRHRLKDFLQGRGYDVDAEP